MSQSCPVHFSSVKPRNGTDAMSRNKDQKKKQREERIRKERHLNSIRSLYPSFLFFNESVVSPDYSKAVKLAVERINLRDFDFGEDGELFHAFLKDMQRYGFKTAFAFAADIVELLKKSRMPSRMLAGSQKDVVLIEDDNLREMQRRADVVAKKHELMVVKVGNAILSSDKELFMSHWPEFGFRLCMVGDRIGIVFQRLHSHYDKTGKYYQYMVPSKLAWGDRNFNIVFKQHAIERIKQRFSTDGVGNYGSYVLMYEFFQNMRSKVVHQRGTNYMQFYFPAFSKLLPAVISMIKRAKTDLESLDPAPCGIKHPFVKAFLSPFDISGDNIHMITALLPGYFPTPEFHTFQHEAHGEMRRKDRVRHFFFSEVDINSPEYHESVEFFHDSGVPQVFWGYLPKRMNPFNIRNWFEMPSHVPDNLEFLK